VISMMHLNVTDTAAMLEGRARRQDKAMALSSGAHLFRKLLKLLAPAALVWSTFSLPSSAGAGKSLL